MTGPAAEEPLTVYTDDEALKEKLTCDKFVIVDEPVAKIFWPTGLDR